jgi:hypothetical protein
MKRIALLVTLLAISGAVFAIFGASAPTIPTPTITPSIMTAGTSKVVTMTVLISDPTLIAGSVNLINLGPSGTQSTILGQLHDDGKNGDALAGDNIYTIQYPFLQSSAGQLELEVSAAFRGQLKRIISPAASLNVWGILTDPVSGFTVSYPPSVYDLSDSSSSGNFLLSNSPLGVNVGETGGDPNLSNTGFNISIRVIPYTTNNFDINQWLTEQYPNVIVGGLAPISIDGQMGYEFGFTEDAGSARLLAVVYHAGSVFQLSYTSTFDPNGSDEESGLAIFSLVVQNFRFGG